MPISTPDFANYNEDVDPVFPGEGLFCYWKTSASLWPARLEKITSNTKPLLIPIYWAFHTLNENSYDFGVERPETDLGKLAELANALGIDCYFLLPLTPIPYWPNGGVPSFLAQTLSLDEQGMAYGIVDLDGRVNKFYSFFGPQTFKAYNRFVKVLKKHLDSLSFGTHIIGFSGGYVKNARFHSYLEDSSPAFQEGFTKYLALQKGDNERDDLFDVVGQDVIQKWDFSRTVADFYRDSATHYLKEYWEGEIAWAFLGGAPADIFRRYGDRGELPSSYFPLLAESLTLSVIPSALLLPTLVKKGILERTLEKIVDRPYFHHQLKSVELYQSSDNTFVPFGHMLFLDFPVPQDERSRWDELGPATFLQTELPSLHRRYQQLNEVRWDEATPHQVFCFYAKSLPSEAFLKMLQLFMNGSIVVFDKDSASEELMRRLNTFILENNIACEKYHYLCQIELYQLGEGKLIILQGDELAKQGPEKQTDFWTRLWATFDIPLVEIKQEGELYTFWKRGHISGREISFDEVRRLHIVNPTSYKKTVTVGWNTSLFTFIRFMDEGQVKLKQKEKGAEMEIWPQSTVTLDFGVIYE